jgi:hypothetical protein
MSFSCRIIGPEGEVYKIAREDLRAFEDAPIYDVLMAPKLKKEPFNIKTTKYKDHYNFKSGKIRIHSSKTNQFEKAKDITRDICMCIFSEEKLFKIVSSEITRFGILTRADWGYEEENYTGHVLMTVIDFNKKIIWWNKCM